jgi:peptidoglycan/xylan/chitin deacetylase (PgdA/CDA1 family)
LSDATGVERRGRGPDRAARPRRGPRHVAGEPFRVALTFDAEHPDRPSEPGTEERILDALERHAIVATFFIQGRWAEACPSTARRIAESGHLIGSHSHYHARMPLFTKAGLRSDIAAAERAILDATGVDPRPWFRCPFGAGSGDRRVQSVIRDAGYRHVGWHAIGRDWPPERTAAEVEDTIVEGCLAHGDGAIVLLHAWPDRTLGAIDGAVARLSEQGAIFVRINGLDHIPEQGGALEEPPVAHADATEVGVARAGAS